MGMRSESRGRCNVSQPEIGASQQQPRAGNAAVDNVIVGRLAGCGLECTVEKPARQSEMPGDFRDREAGVHPRFDDLVDEPKSSSSHPTRRAGWNRSARQNAGYGSAECRDAFLSFDRIDDITGQQQAAQILGSLDGGRVDTIVEALLARSGRRQDKRRAERQIFAASDDRETTSQPFGT
jgi:hypothetical protein